MPARKHTPSYLWSYGTNPSQVNANTSFASYVVISEDDARNDAIAIRRVKGVHWPTLLTTAGGTAPESAYARGFAGWLYVPTGTTLDAFSGGGAFDDAAVQRRIFGTHPWLATARLSQPYMIAPTKFWIPRNGNLLFVIYTDATGGGGRVDHHVSCTGRYKMYRRDVGNLLDLGQQPPDDDEDDDEES